MHKGLILSYQDQSLEIDDFLINVIGFVFIIILERSSLSSPTPWGLGQAHEISASHRNYFKKKKTYTVNLNVHIFIFY